jgi:parallel beta-helix repeat protein
LSGRGILLRDNNNVKIVNNKVEKFRMGIYGYTCTDTTIESNEIENCKRYYIYLYGFKNTSITNNNFVIIPKSNVQCINLYSCSDMTISKNSIIGDYNELGIYTANGKRINITDNKISGFRYYAIYAYRSSEVVISSNIVESCTEGIKLYRTSESVITKNTVNGNRYAIKLSRSSNNVVYSNDITNNVKVGLQLDYGSHRNLIYDNTIKNNEWGICMYSSNYNTIHSNIIVNNEKGGLYIRYSSQNEIYNNLLNNTYNVYVDNVANTWNTTKTAGSNIIGGNYIGGNAWLKPDGTGFSQTCIDENRDGICDSAYVINNQNVDYLPLKAK